MPIYVVKTPISMGVKKDGQVVSQELAPGEEIDLPKAVADNIPWAVGPRKK